MEILARSAAELGFKLTQKQLGQFETYYRELVYWNRKLNLTAIIGYEAVQTKHFLDSLTVVLAWLREAIPRDEMVIDIGSGAGLPGIPIKIVFPGIRLTLLEATGKKAAFLEHLKTMLELSDTEIVIGRAEEVAHHKRYRERFDLVLSRAVAGLPTLTEITLPFGKVGGRLIAQKKGDISDELSAAARAISLLGGHFHEVKCFNLKELPDHRCLVVIDKTSPTPGIYPRRPGLPIKKPL